MSINDNSKDKYFDLIFSHSFFLCLICIWYFWSVNKLRSKITYIHNRIHANVILEILLNVCSAIFTLSVCVCFCCQILYFCHFCKFFFLLLLKFCFFFVWWNFYVNIPVVTIIINSHRRRIGIRRSKSQQNNKCLACTQ